MSIWEQVLLALGGSAVLLGVVAWLVKAVISQLLSKDIERYKSELAATKEKELEHLRSGLRAELLEREIRMRVLQERLAEVVGNVYERLVSAYEALLRFTAPMGRGTNEEEDASVAGKLNEFRAYFLPREVYFGARAAQKIKDLAEMFREAHKNKRWAYGLDPMIGELASDEAMKCHGEAMRIVESAAPSLLSEVREELQRMLGANGGEATDGERGASGEKA